MAKIYGTATQGSADAFVQSSIQTALTGQTRNAYRVTQISVEGLRQTLGAASEISIALTRRSKTAMPLLSDTDVMWKNQTRAEITTSGAIYLSNGIVTYRPSTEDEIVIVEDPIYVQLDSTATTVAQSCVIVIEYEIVTISEIDRLTLLTTSLA